MERPGRVAVALVTFRRPANLPPLLPKLLDQAGQAMESLGFDFDFVIIVVDNDPLGSASKAVSEIGDDRIRYVIEPSPGVTSARNRALTAAADCDVLAFIDDDELPHPGWLAALIATGIEYDADLVGGPVESVFEGPLDPWVEASGTYLRGHRSHLATGDTIVRAATNNLLLDLNRLREFGVVFDQRFGLTGGEDSFFSGQLQQRGARMVWCAEAVVDDLVPLSRANREYNLRRRFSLSNAGGRVDVLLTEGWPRVGARVVCAARGVAQMGMGATMAVRGRARGSLELQSQGERYVVGGLGVLAAAAGIAAMPYRRKPRVK
jgi:glycosyltransferase involved in cell wall biosynthesis